MKKNKGRITYSIEEMKKNLESERLKELEERKRTEAALRESCLISIDLKSKAMTWMRSLNDTNGLMIVD